MFNHNHQKLLQFLFLSTILFQLSFQQSNNFLSNIIQNVDEATVGHGNQGVVITNEGGNTLDDSLFHFQSIEFEGLSSDEWTVQWIDNEGEAFELIDENGLIIAVGPNNSTEDVTNQLASTAGIPAASVSGLIGTLTEDVVQEVEKSGGNETLTGNQVYSKAIVPVSLAVLGAKTATSAISSGLDNAGDAISQAATDGANNVKDAAESVGDTVGDAASDAWADTKDAANSVADKASDIGNTIADKATEFGENVSDAAQDAWEDTKDVTNTVADKASDIGNSIANGATDAANTVAGKATEFGENVSDAAQDAWDKTKDVADSVGDAVGNAVDSLKDGISNLFGN